MLAGMHTLGSCTETDSSCIMWWISFGVLGNVRTLLGLWSRVLLNVNAAVIAGGLI
jgi:hypothetical protein